MTRSARIALLSVLLTFLCGSMPPLSTAMQAPERRMYVSVLDQAGAPVTGLGPSDFIVREEGVRREVLRVMPATDPMQIALLVDTSQAVTSAIREIRDALTTFVDQMAGKNEIALISFGGRATILTDYTTNAELLKKGIGRLFAEPESGQYLLEAIVETSRGLQKREAARPLIVVVGVEGTEFSNWHHEQVLEPLKKSGAALHSLMLGISTGVSTEVRERNIVLDRGTKETGGRRDNLLTSMAFGPRMKAVAAELSNQYVVVYARPQSLIPPEKIEVSVAKPGLTARGTPAKSE